MKTSFRHAALIAAAIVLCAPAADAGAACNPDNATCRPGNFDRFYWTRRFAPKPWRGKSCRWYRDDRISGLYRVTL